MTEIKAQLQHGIFPLREIEEFYKLLSEERGIERDGCFPQTCTGSHISSLLTQAYYMSQYGLSKTLCMMEVECIQ